MKDVIGIAVFAFTLALRQFNHFCIMIGAMDHTGRVTEAEMRERRDLQRDLRIDAVRPAGFQIRRACVGGDGETGITRHFDRRKNCPD